MIYSNLEYLNHARSKCTSYTWQSEIIASMKKLRIDPDEPCGLWEQYVIDSLLFAVIHGVDRADKIAKIYQDTYHCELRHVRTIEPESEIVDLHEIIKGHIEQTN